MVWLRGFFRPCVSVGRTWVVLATTGHAPGLPIAPPAFGWPGRSGGLASSGFEPGGDQSEEVLLGAGRRQVEARPPCIAGDHGADLQQLEADGGALRAGHPGAGKPEPVDPRVQGVGEAGEQRAEPVGPPSVARGGAWGGIFSSRHDEDGNPRLVAGFNSVYFEESDGSEGEFVGSFLGLSEAFKKTGVSRPFPRDGG